MPSNELLKQLNLDSAVPADAMSEEQTFRDDVDELDGSKFNVQSSR
jgi:hypothetical protein